MYGHHSLFFFIRRAFTLQNTGNYMQLQSKEFQHYDSFQRCPYHPVSPDFHYHKEADFFNYTDF